MRALLWVGGANAACARCHLARPAVSRQFLPCRLRESQHDPPMALLNSALLVVGGAVIGGVCGGLLVTSMAPPRDEPKLRAAPQQEAPQGMRASDDEGAESVEALRTRLASVERRVSLLTFAQDHRSPTREAAEGEGNGEEEPGKPKKTVDDPVFEAAVRDVLDRVQDERDSQRNTRRDQREAESVDRWVAAVGPQLQLRDDQQTQIKAILQKQSESMRALRDSNTDERPMLRSEWRAKMQEISQQTEAALVGVLDASQRAKYDALDEDDKIASQRSFGGAGRGQGGR